MSPGSTTIDHLRLVLSRQFTLAYMLAEVALIAVALAALRIAVRDYAVLVELRTGLFCPALVAAFGALGGLCLRMAVGLVAGGVFAVASIPMLLVLIGATTRS